LRLFSLVKSSLFPGINKFRRFQVTIKNFGDGRPVFPRGQPRKMITRIGCARYHHGDRLAGDRRSYEKANVEALGMKYVNIPMSDKDYPESAKIEQFLKLVDDPRPEVLCALRRRTSSHGRDGRCLPVQSLQLELRSGLRGDEEVRLLHSLGTRRHEEVRQDYALTSDKASAQRT
jgi:hypothetical protein